MNTQPGTGSFRTVNATEGAYPAGAPAQPYPQPGNVPGNQYQPAQALPAYPAQYPPQAGYREPLAPPPATPPSVLR